MSLHFHFLNRYQQTVWMGINRPFCARYDNSDHTMLFAGLSVSSLFVNTTSPIGVVLPGYRTRFFLSFQSHSSLVYFGYKIGVSLPNQSKRSRSVLRQGRSRYVELFWEGKPSYNRRKNLPLISK